ncbi:MAG: 30S ribosomal protein S12 methylthiotransferase RimO [bacterium]|nr:30S ribosomal protein S12 methylthiotransferase RimO [bacterium]
MAIRVGITSLGCAKNLVDSEVILGYARRGGLRVCEELGEAEIVIVNTCAFIAEAEEEARETIGRLAALKAAGALRGLIVAGCMPARRGRALAAEFPSVDYFLSPGEIPAVARVVRSLFGGGRRPAGARGRLRAGWFLYDHRSPRLRLSPPHTAYVKVSEGCGNRCSYCLIPSIKGPLRSRRPASVVREARSLAAAGVREINLIAQDTTAFGTDSGGRSRLRGLLRDLARIEGLAWIRLLYGHPARWTDDLLECIAAEPRVCAYVDFPLQHVSDRILRAMNRRMTGRQAAARLRAARSIIPGVTVRTTFIVGFPGETEGEFRELLDFVREARFEHLGAFIYSPEEGTAAARMAGGVPPAVRRERLDRLMALQQGIVREQNERMVGRTVTVMVDGEADGGGFALRGRTEGDAPDVDGTVYISGNGARPGDLAAVRVTGAMEYDLAGELVRGAGEGAA